MAWHQLPGKANGIIKNVAWWTTISPFCVGSKLSSLGASSRRPLHLGSDANPYPWTELLDRLWAFRNRVRMARSLLILPRAMVLCGLILLIAKVIQVLTLHPASGWLALALFLVLGWGFHLAFHHAIPSFEVARLVDRRAGLQAQIATAVEYTLARRADEPLSRTQIRQATARLRELEPRRVVPLVWPGREASILVLVAVLYGGLGFVGSLGLTLPRHPQAIDTELAKLASQDAQAPTSYVTMDAAQAQLPNSVATTNQTLPQLQTLQQELAAKSITPQQYQTQLRQLQQQLQAQASQSLAEQQALNALASALKDSSTTHAVSDSLARGDYPQAESQLNDLSSQLDKLSPQARSELASGLAQAAAQTKQADPSIAQSAQQASNALKNGDNAPASQSLQSLSKAVQQASSKIATQAQLGQALQDVQSGLGNQQQSQSPASSAPNTSNGQTAQAAMTPSASGQAPSGQSQTQGNAAGSLDQPSGQSGDSSSQPGDSSGQSGPGSSSNQLIQQGQASSAGSAGNGPGSGALDAKPTPLDVGGVKLSISGQASDNGNDQNQAGDRSTPLTGADGSTISGGSSAAAASSNVPINVHQESNVVPLELKPVVRDYFSNAGS